MGGKQQLDRPPLSDFQDNAKNDPKTFRICVIINKELVSQYQTLFVHIAYDLQVCRLKGWGIFGKWIFVIFLLIKPSVCIREFSKLNCI